MIGTASVPAAFAHDKFLMRQKINLLNQQYRVSDEGGHDILFIERRGHTGRHILALLGAIVGGFAMMGGLVAVAMTLPEGSTQDVAIVFAMLAGVAGIVAIGIRLSPLRHVVIYGHESTRDPLLEIRQDRRVQLIRATYTIRTPDGEVLARLEKRTLYDLFRKRWYCRDADGRLVLVIKEDSPIRALLRRLIGPLFGMLRTNFVFYRDDMMTVAGEFNRQLTLLDRYVLDMSQDPGRTIDRRVAVAIGVMLDTGERR